ncbi:putative salicylate protein [Botrytis fragariae]|uniref:Putative salicylate protein n=1 Tax=Botrytis fragariae TaxID=1964551 RepID=A0A8H6ELF1_9HELO|nr:putative salicylate protein [Botrytis fragariae]KAF5876543.1 putative salicylate protein [Botrytis fragariae]
MFEGRKELYFDFSGGYHDNGSEFSKFYFSLFNEIVGFMPQDIAEFRKRVVDESGDQGLFTLYFADCTTATAEAVIGADRVNSYVRQSVFGEDTAANTEMYLGLDGHVITLPVDRGETMNVVAFTRTKEGSINLHRFTRAATEQDTLNELADWSKNVTPILSLLNEYVDTWAILDMLDHLASTYAKEYISTARV